MKIRINIKSIIFMTLIALASLLFINISFAANTGKIAIDTAKLREEPNTDSKVLELASLNEEVEILEKSNDWYKVKYKKITGYIRADLITIENKAETEIKSNSNLNQENVSENVDTSTNELTKNNMADDPTVEASTETTEEKKIEINEKYKLSENTKLKVIPLISSIEIEELGKDSEIEVIEILNDWAKVRSTDGKEGWLIENKLVIEYTKKPEQNTQSNIDTTSKVMYVNAQVANVREKADKESQVVKQISVNTQVTVLSTSNGWANIEVDGIKAYVSESLLSSTKQETSRSAITQNEKSKTTEKEVETKTSTTTKSNTDAPVSTTTNTSTSGSSVVSYAKQFLGYKYIYGGTTTSGFDCSGFTQFVYKNFGVMLNRTAAAQYSNGTSVTNLQSGDLVMFGKSGINHVGIYIGGNTFIHSANPSRGVTTDTLASGYYKTNYVGARRIF